MEKIIEERNVYLYELTGERFKEIKSVLKKYDTNKTVIVRGDNGKVLIATSEESKVFKNNCNNNDFIINISCIIRMWN